MRYGRKTLRQITLAAACCSWGIVPTGGRAEPPTMAPPIAARSPAPYVPAAMRATAFEPPAGPAVIPAQLDPLPLNPAKLWPESELRVWWNDLIRQPLGDPQEALPIELDPAVVQALTHSAHVAVLRDTAAIACTAVPRAEANFDALRFAESRFTDTSDPVGNTLTTGGAPRFIDETWYANAGLRRRTLTGAQLEMSQRLGYQNNNSLFFVPKNQATARMNISLTQPLLRGAGVCYNNSVIVLAQIDADMAHDQLASDLQAYLVDLHKSFWDLYLQRAGFLQRRRLLVEAQEVLAELEARRNVDVVSTQLARARAAVATREVAVYKFEAAAKNAVARFKSLVNDPFLDQACLHELIPLNPPDACYGDADLGMSLATALDARPEIHLATRSLRAASTRLQVSQKDLLPLLNLVLGTYASGLQGQADFGNALGDQFSVGRPTYWGGLTYEIPWGNRSAKAQYQARQLELRRAGAQLQAVAATIRAEVEIASRDVTTTCREVRSKYQAMLAEQQEVELLTERWRSLAGDQQVAGIVLNDLLDAQDRRAVAELEMVNAQVSHRVAWIQLKRVTGTLCDLSAVTGNEALLPPVTTTESLGVSPAESVPPPQPAASEPNSPSDIPRRDRPSVEPLEPRRDAPPTPPNAAALSAPPVQAVASSAYPVTTPHAAQTPHAASLAPAPRKTSAGQLFPPPPLVAQEPIAPRSGPAVVVPRRIELFPPPPLPVSDLDRAHGARP